MIRIKIINSKSISIFLYCIKIYDSMGNLLVDKYVDGMYIFNNKKIDLYKLEIYSKCLYPYYKEIYFVPINDILVCFNDNKFLTFRLIDKNYNLPIKGGVINLCKKKNK